jgi:hypothetical protein
MHTLKFAIAVVSFLAVNGCTGKTVDAGTNDAGTDTGLVGPATPTTIASGLPLTPQLMASDGTTLFWTDQLGNLTAMPVQGGPMTTLTNPVYPRGFLTVDSANVYFTQFDAPSGTGALYALPKAGGSPAKIAGGISVRAVTLLAVVRDATAFWVGAGTSLGDVVESSPVQGGAVSTFFVLPAGHQLGTGFWGIASTTNTVFVGIGPNLLLLPSTGVPDGGTPPVVAAPEGACDDAFVADDSAAFCFPSLGSASRIASDGTSVELATVYGAGSVALDDTDVYWADQPATGNVVNRVPKQGGPVSVIANEPMGTTVVAVDSAAVYWANGPTIKRLAK